MTPSIITRSSAFIVFKILGRAFLTRFGSACQYVNVHVIAIEYGKKERETEAEKEEGLSYFISFRHFLHPRSFTVSNIHHRWLPSFGYLHVNIQVVHDNADITVILRSFFTLKTMWSSIFSPAFPGYFVAMLAGVRSNIFAPVSVQIA